jgi:hypothetical protein
MCLAYAIALGFFRFLKTLQAEKLAYLYAINTCCQIALHLSFPA